MAWWIETGRCVAAGSRRSNAASVSAWPCSRVWLSMRLRITRVFAESSTTQHEETHCHPEQGAPLRLRRGGRGERPLEGNGGRRWERFAPQESPSPVSYVQLIGVLRLRNGFASRSRYPAQDDSLREALSGSKASVWSFPFCFSRISTLPSASSNSLRQAAESCIPSSNSVRDFSRGTSPFSSSCTIFSRRWRHSSNLAKEALLQQF